MGETRMARTRARVTRYLHKRGEESGRDDHTQTNIPTYALERWVHSYIPHCTIRCHFELCMQ